MRVIRRILTPLVATALGFAAFGLAVRIYMGREAENRLAPSEAVSIAELHSPLPEPGFLFCPPGYCLAAEAIASPVFPLPWERLHEYWTEVISGQKRVETMSPIPTTGGSFISNIRRRSDFPTSSPSSSFHSDRIVRALQSTAGLGMVIMISEIIASGSGNGWPCWRKWRNRRLGAERALSDLTQMSDKSGGGRVALSVPSASLSYSRANSSNRNLIARVVTPSATWRARAALRR